MEVGRIPPLGRANYAPVWDIRGTVAMWESRRGRPGHAGPGLSAAPRRFPMFLFQSRRAVATLSLAAALFLVLPAPSQAAGLWTAPSEVISRVWSWMEGLGIVRPAVP